MKRIIALLLAVLTVLSMSSCNKNGEGEDTTAAPKNDYNADSVALSSENYTITMGELSYVFYENFQDFVVNNHDNLSVYGLDTSSSIKNQTYYGTTTWFQYFADASVGYAEDILRLCEGAAANGITLDADDTAGIDSTIQSIISYAEDNGYATADFLSSVYSSNVSLDIIRSFLEKETLGKKYYANLIGQYEFSDEQMNEYVSANADKFNTICYMSYTFDEDNDTNAQTAAEELSQINDADTFASFVSEYMTNTLKYTDEQKANVAVSTYYALQDSDSEFSKWAFGDNALVNQTHTEFNDVDGQYTVYLLTKTPGLQDYVARNMRYAFLSLDTYNTYTAALAKANELLASWQSGEATESSFAEMIYNNSNDSSSTAQGGVATNVSRRKGATAFPDRLLEWLYADTTAMGTASVIRGDNGYYIAYYSSDGETEWHYEAKSALAAEKYDADHSAMEESYPVTTNDEVVSSIDA